MRRGAVRVGEGEFAERASEQLRRQLSYLVRSASLELTPREILEAAPYRRLLVPGTRVFIPHLTAARIATTVAAVKALGEDGIVAVPHIAARRLRSEFEFEDLLDRLRDAGCREALIIGGGVAHSAGPYASAMDLLQSGKLQRAGVRRVGIAGHPEGSPDVSSRVLREAFVAKNTLAAAGIFDMYVVSQFCFEAHSVIAWERSVRQLGNHLPVHVGLPGVTSGAKLLRYASICGVKVSAGFLRQGVSTLGKLLMRWTPSSMVAEIAAETILDSNCMIRQFHFFPFGGFPDTVAWINAVGQGRYTIKEGSDALNIAIEDDAA